MNPLKDLLRLMILLLALWSGWSARGTYETSIKPVQDAYQPVKELFDHVSGF